MRGEKKGRKRAENGGKNETCHQFSWPCLRHPMTATLDVLPGTPDLLDALTDALESLTVAPAAGVRW